MIADHTLLGFILFFPVYWAVCGLNAFSECEGYVFIWGFCDFFGFDSSYFSAYSAHDLLKL